MRFQKVISPAALLLTAVVLLNCPSIIGQVLQPIQSPQKNQPNLTPLELGNPVAKASSTRSNEEEPYKLSSRLHLQKGTNTGYLIVKVELPKGSYIYSVTQQAPLRPSKIKVSKSKQFRLKGEFTPDRPATVIENDPIFKQRLEKHTDVIQFFAPVEITPDVPPKSLQAEIAFSGQVCNDRGFCLPILAAKTNGRFAGFFERSAEKRSNTQSTSPIGNQPR